MVDQCGKRGDSMSKLTILEEYAAQAMVGQGKNAEEIAKVVKRPVKLVEKYLATFKVASVSAEAIEKAIGEPKPAEAIVEPVITPIGPPGPKAKDFFIKHGQGAEADAKPRVSIMTKTASEMGDEARKNMPLKTKNKGAVYKLDTQKIE